jgi:hypothetical protein
MVRVRAAFEAAAAIPAQVAAETPSRDAWQAAQTGRN